MNITLTFSSYEELDAFCLAHVAGRSGAEVRVRRGGHLEASQRQKRARDRVAFETRLRDLLEEDEHLVMGGRDAMEKLEEANLLHLIPLAEANLRRLSKKKKLSVTSDRVAKNVAMLLEALAAVSATRTWDSWPCRPVGTDGFLGGAVESAAAITGLSYSYASFFTPSFAKAGLLTTRQGVGTKLNVDPALILSPGLLQQLRKEV